MTKTSKRLDAIEDQIRWTRVSLGDLDEAIHNMQTKSGPVTPVLRVANSKPILKVLVARPTGTTDEHLVDEWTAHPDNGLRLFRAGQPVAEYAAHSWDSVHVVQEPTPAEKAFEEGRQVERLEAMTKKLAEAEAAWKATYANSPSTAKVGAAVSATSARAAKAAKK